jgi:hypothetical protein
VTQQFRYDHARIEPDWEETPEGYLRIRATFSRCGLQRYRRMDGSEVVEYRPEAEVCAEKALLSLANLPVTLEHPPELLTPDTARAYTRGFTGSHVEYKSPFASGIVTVTDREAIESIKRGDSREVSVGYRVEFDPTPGVTPAGERYDGIQRAISGNHVAIVREARGGREVRLHMDSAVAIDPIPTTPTSEENSMTATVKALNSATDALALALRQQSRLDMEGPEADPEDDENNGEGEMAPVEDDEKEGDDPDEKEDSTCGKRGDSRTVSWVEHVKALRELEESKASHQRDLGRIDSLIERLDSLEIELESRQDSTDGMDLNALVAARIQLLEKAESVGGVKPRLDSNPTDREIMLTALQAAGVSADRFDGMSDEYVAGQFEAYAEHPTAGRADSAALLTGVLRGVRSDADADPVEAARARMVADAEAASQRPLSERAA